MIDLGSTFENGMGYVALSRAKKLDNVYLIDFHPNSLFCEIKCVNEYNRLREKHLNIKPIEIYNSINNSVSKIPKKPLTKEFLSKFEKMQLNLINIENNIQDKKFPDEKFANNKTSSNRPKTIASNIPPNYCLKLNNYDNACFANVILQAFLAFGENFYHTVF